MTTGKNRKTDIIIFLWLVPLANVINYYLTYSHIRFSPKTLVTFLIDTAEGFITWLLMRFIIQRLENRFPFKRNPGKRIAIQLPLTVAAAVLATIFFTEAINALAGKGPVPANFYTEDIFIISIWFLVVNAIYIGLHFYDQWQESEEIRRQETEIRSGGFRVSTGKKELLFEFASIGGFYIEGEYSMLVTCEKSKYLVDASLDKVEKTVPQELFFRLNRQYIIHRQWVKGFEKGENGKLIVLVTPQDHLPVRIPVSRTRAPRFKTWFHPA